MKKVRYSVSKYQKGGPLTMSGTGYITETDLVIACTNKYGKLYVRIFEDALKYCCAKRDPVEHLIQLGHFFVLKTVLAIKQYYS